VRTRAAAAFIPLLTAGSLSGCPEPTPSCVVRGTEVCNGVDDDCNGLIDDGVPIGPEICNGEDDDCDGTIDEGVFGVLSGPWLIAENIPSMRNMAVTRRSDDGTIVVWSTWSDVPSSEQFHGRYAVHASDGTQIALAELPVPLVEGVEATTLEGQSALLVSESGNIDPGRKPHRLLMFAVANDGSLSGPTTVWTPPDTTLAYVTEAVVHADRMVAAVALADFGDTIPRFGHLALLLIDSDGAVLEQWPSSPLMWTDERGRGGQLTSSADGGWVVAWDAAADQRQGLLFSGPPPDLLGGTTTQIDWTQLGLPSAVAATTSLSVGGLLADNSTSALEGDRLLTPFVTFEADGDTARDAGLVVVRRVGASFLVDEFVSFPYPSMFHFSPSVTTLRQGTFVFAAASTTVPEQPGRIGVWHARDAARFAAVVQDPTAIIEVPDIAENRLRFQLFGAASYGGDRAFVVAVVELVEGGRVRPVVERMYGAVLGCR
jgi:hypothetical protein